MHAEEVEEGSVANLHRAFPGTRTVAEITYRATPLDPPTRARRRGQVRRQVEQCRACGLGALCSTPVPYHGPVDPAFIALGEAPGEQEEKQGRPFVGPSGQKLRRMFGAVAIDHERVFYCNVASCWPRDDRRTRAPNTVEMTACRRNLIDQLDVARARYVLLLGATALKAFRDDLQVSKVHGNVFMWNARWITMATFHPAAVLRDPTLEGNVAADLTMWKKVIEDDNWLAGQMQWCVRCGQRATEWDRDLVAYCQQHWARVGEKSWKRAREKWKKAESGQTTVYDFTD